MTFTWDPIIKDQGYTFSLHPDFSYHIHFSEKRKRRGWLISRIAVNPGIRYLLTKPITWRTNELKYFCHEGDLTRQPFKSFRAAADYFTANLQRETKFITQVLRILQNDIDKANTILAEAGPNTLQENKPQGSLKVDIDLL